jgi:general bacterial porin, GBP family
MKKLLIATAALAMVAGTAQAQSTVTVYGKVDAGYSDRKQEGTSATSKGKSFAFNAHETSRFGLRGTEDLGGGLKANFVIETQLGNDNSNAGATEAALQGTAPVIDEALGGRAMWVGVSGGFGEVRVGFQNAFSKDYVAGFSSSGGSNVVGDPTMAAGRGVEKTARLGLLDSRYNGVSYATKAMSGFTVKAMLVSDKQDNNVTNTVTAGEKNVTGQEFALQFAQGPFAAAASFGAYEVNGTSIASNLTVTSAESATVQKQDVLSLNASYDLGVAKLFAKYGDVKQKQNGGSATTDGKATATVVGVRAPIGKTTLFANYAKGDYESVTGTTSFDDTGYQLGLEHALSKRTKVYAIYGATDTDISTSTKEKDTQVAFGLIHNF